jgi:hypothetical protein
MAFAAAAAAAVDDDGGVQEQWGMYGTKIAIPA